MMRTKLLRKSIVLQQIQMSYLHVLLQEQWHTLLKLYQIYDDHRNARLWFLDGLDAANYNEYNEKYSGASMERSHFIGVCGFFELSGTLVNHGLIDQNLYFEIFNPTPFWNKAKPIIEGMRSKRSDSHYYENFESLNTKKLSWKKKRSKQ
jgi:Domain of unknown function (DUF4760)